MRKILIISFALLGCMPVYSRLLNVTSISKVDVPHNEATEQVVDISADGKYLLLTSQSQEGLVGYDLTSKKMTTISTAPAAGFNAKITDNRKNIIFQEMQISDDGLTMKHGVKSMSIKNKKMKTILQPVEGLSSFAISNETATVMTEGRKIKGFNLNGKTSKIENPVLTNDNLKVWLTLDGKTVKIAPQGDEFSYIWESLSPDKTKIMYVNEAGCFVCDLNGQIIADLGELRAPKWINDTLVVGMLDHDDGTVTTSSEIVVKDMRGNAQIITDPLLVGMWPQVGENVIAFSNPKGEIYIINFENEK